MTSVDNKPGSEGERAEQQSVLLIEGLACGDLGTIRGLYDGPADIDDPFAGHTIDGGLEALVRAWRPVEDARYESLRVDGSAVNDSMCGVELTLFATRSNGSELQLAIALVGEFRGGGLFERVRLYYRRYSIDGQQHWRDRVLDEEVEATFDPVVARYQEALRERDLGGVMASFGADPVFDGHGDAQDLSTELGMGRYEGREAIEALFTQMLGLASGSDGRYWYLEHVNVFSEGKTTVLEFNVVYPQENRFQAGVAFYELGDDGLIREARVYDEAV